MTANPGDPHLVIVAPSTVAVVRDTTVPMTSVGEFIGRSLQVALNAAADQRVAVVGPPLAAYYGKPTETVDIAAGFPTATAVDEAESVTAETLPGGQAVQVLHVGSYDALRETYDRLMAWLDGQPIELGEVMWESYLNDPEEVGTDAAQTLITWPLRGAGEAPGPGVTP